MSTSLLRCTGLAISMCIVSAAGVLAAEAVWPQFRGPDGTGKAAVAAAERDHTWGDAPEPVWSTELPGYGWSSPVYHGNTIWLTAAVVEQASEEEIKQGLKGKEFPSIKTLVRSVEFHALAVHATSGRLLHDIQLAKTESPEPINPLNSYASPTPAIAAGRVVCHFGNYGTWCLDAGTGKEVWHRKLVVDHSVGPGSSPIIWRDRVLLTCDGMDKQFVTGLDLQTGKDVWRSSRPPIRAFVAEMKKAYSTPLIVNVDGAAQAVVTSAQWVAAYDPKDGRELWRAKHGSGYSVTPMPTLIDGLVAICTGYTRSVHMAIDPTGTGDVTDTHIRWKAKNAPTMPSMLAVDAQLFSLHDDGILSCLDGESGKSLGRKRLGGSYSASPLLIGDNIYTCSRDGVVTVIRASAAMEKLARVDLGETIMATPAPLGEDLLIRTRNRLIRLPSLW